MAHVFCLICNLNKLVHRNCLLQVQRVGSGTCPCMLQCAVNSNTEDRQLTFLLCLASSDLLKNSLSAVHFLNWEEL